MSPLFSSLLYNQTPLKLEVFMDIVGWVLIYNYIQLNF